MISRTVVADSVAPTAQVSPTLVLSGTLGFIRGTAWDDFPTARAPHRIEVSINGGRFQPAFPTLSGGQALGAGTRPD